MIYHGWKSEEWDERGDLHGLQREIDRVIAALEPKKKSFDSIVVMGMSGVIVGVPVSLALDKPLVIVRKNTEDCHSTQRLINKSEIGKKALFLDDFVSNGSTRQRVCLAVAELGARVVAQSEYCPERSYSVYEKINKKDFDSWVKWETERLALGA